MQTKTDSPSTGSIPRIELKLNRRRVQIAADAPDMSSDGGAVLLRQLDEKQELTASFCVADRGRYSSLARFHSLTSSSPWPKR